MGPILITHFVNFLSGKGDDSSYYYGLVLALILFMVKTMESLLQRQWHLGRQQIGIKVRATLTVLVYKKSLPIQYVGSNSRNQLKVRFQLVTWMLLYYPRKSMNYLTAIVIEVEAITREIFL